MKPNSKPDPFQVPVASLAVGAQVRGVIEKFPMIELALLFGSVAAGLQRADSDLDIAIAAKHRLTADEKMDIIASLAEATGARLTWWICGRPVSRYWARF